MAFSLGKFDLSFFFSEFGQNLKITNNYFNLGVRASFGYQD